jgi:hypothetical protein
VPPNPRILVELVGRAKAVQVAGQVVWTRVVQLQRVISTGYGIGNVVVYNPDGSINIEATASNAIAVGRSRDQVNNTGVPAAPTDRGEPVVVGEGDGVETTTLPMWQHDP